MRAPTTARPIRSIIVIGVRKTSANGFEVSTVVPLRCSAMLFPASEPISMSCRSSASINVPVPSVNWVADIDPVVALPHGVDAAARAIGGLEHHHLGGRSHGGRGRQARHSRADDDNLGGFLLLVLRCHFGSWLWLIRRREPLVMP